MVQWREFVENLPTAVLPHEPNDLTGRVFKMKLKQLLNDQTKQNVHDKTIGYIYVIEFLPHAHILLILQGADKLLTSDDYNSVACAEIPHPIMCPNLYNIILHQ